MLVVGLHGVDLRWRVCMGLVWRDMWWLYGWIMDSLPL